VRNTISGGTTWQTTTVESDGIEAVNGKSPYLVSPDKGLISAISYSPKVKHK
jgi:hypothetical protein